MEHKTTRYYTKNQPHLCFTTALLLTFSPYVQWWFSQSIAEALIFDQGMALCMLHSVRETETKQCILWAILFAWNQLGEADGYRLYQLEKLETE